MLSWSGHENGSPVDLATVRRSDAAPDGAGVGAGVDAGVELLAFADAATGARAATVADGPIVLGAARAALAARLDPPSMLDAAAVVANFEMMTRLADGTGARMTEEQLVERRTVSEALGVSDLTSRR